MGVLFDGLVLIGGFCVIEFYCFNVLRGGWVGWVLVFVWCVWVG